MKFHFRTICCVLIVCLASTSAVTSLAQERSKSTVDRSTIEERTIKIDRDELQSAAIDAILDILREHDLEIKMQGERLNGVEERSSTIESRVDEINQRIQQKLELMQAENREIAAKLSSPNQPGTLTVVEQTNRPGALPTPAPPAPPVIDRSDVPFVRTVALRSFTNVDVTLGTIVFRGQSGIVVSRARGTLEVQLAGGNYLLSFASNLCPHCTICGRIPGSNGDMLVAYQACTRRFVVSPAS